ALALLDGGLAMNRDVASLVGVSWVVVLAASIAVRRGYLHGVLERMGIGGWIDNVTVRELLPYVAWFALFGCYDVAIQGLAARSFGLEIDWIALVARIPVMYLALLIPSLGNFGTREIAFASLFEEYGTRETLYAFALWTNTIFLAMHVIIGALFLGRAIALVREVQIARKAGQPIPRPILRDAIDP
ncbi:MAG: flippase-like domain-containing protein, partial [Deltaproteobacteria bacterium]|nr:flippase-like domain-containing protein [Deltaproteobacteria bacterium]